jgi:hypothetical protein
MQLPPRTAPLVVACRMSEERAARTALSRALHSGFAGQRSRQCLAQLIRDSLCRPWYNGIASVT